MLQYLQWESLESRRSKIQLTLFYKVMHDLVDDIKASDCLNQASARTRSSNFNKFRQFSTSFDSFKKKMREKSKECHNHKPQPFPDTKRKRKPTNPKKHKSNKRTKSTKISSLFPKRGNRNAKSTEKHNNKMTQGKT